MLEGQYSNPADGFALMLQRLGSGPNVAGEVRYRYDHLSIDISANREAFMDRLENRDPAQQRLV
jgi:hypothetical protein